MINSLIHHLGIGLQDPQAAEAFYDALLVEFLGMEKEEVWESVAGYKGRGTRIYLYPIKTEASPGALQHLAFTARSKQEVDRLAIWANEKGIEIIDPPHAYPKYGGDYYAVFFQAPENLKLELVYLTEADRAKPL
ncbi:MAG: VOC family protein [Cyanobacteria bacterium P01_A01_bin.84]